MTFKGEGLDEQYMEQLEWLEGKVALVTGGIGFVGRHMVELLLRAGAKVRVFDFARPSEEDPLPEGVEYMHGDLRDDDSVHLAVEGGQRVRGETTYGQAEVVFHVASPSPLCNNATLFQAVNVGGTRRLLRSCQELGVTRFVYTSSASVAFDGTDQKNYNEGFRVPTPIDFYTGTKRAAEDLVLAAASSAAAQSRKSSSKPRKSRSRKSSRGERKSKGREQTPLLTVSVRPHGIFGPGDVHFWPTLAQVGARGKSKWIIGDSNNLGDWTYVENVVYAHLLAACRLDRPGVSGQAFFITNREPKPFWWFLGRVYKYWGYPEPRLSLPFGMMKVIGSISEAVGKAFGFNPTFTKQKVLYAGTHHYYDSQKAADLFDYHPAVTLEEGFDRSMRYFYQRHRNPKLKQAEGAEQPEAKNSRKRRSSRKKTRGSKKSRRSSASQEQEQDSQAWPGWADAALADSVTRFGSLGPENYSGSVLPNGGLPGSKRGGGLGGRLGAVVGRALPTAIKALVLLAVTAFLLHGDGWVGSLLAADSAVVQYANLGYAGLTSAMSCGLGWLCAGYGALEHATKALLAWTLSWPMALLNAVLAASGAAATVSCSCCSLSWAARGLLATLVYWLYKGSEFGQSANMFLTRVPSPPQVEGTTDFIPSLYGRTAVITGGNRGLGYSTGVGLLMLGARVIVACRSKSQGEAAGHRMKQEALRRFAALPDAAAAESLSPVVRVVTLDLGEMGSVGDFPERLEDALQAQDLEGEGIYQQEVDLLVLNAGAQLPIGHTGDHMESSFQINYFGHWVLANALWQSQMLSADVRVVSVSSVMHKLATIDFTRNLQYAPAVLAQLERDPDSTGDVLSSTAQYSLTKLYNLLFAYELDRLFVLEAQQRGGVGGCKRTSVAVHPGAVATDFTTAFLGKLGAKLLHPLLRCLIQRTPWQGCQSILYACCSPHLEGVGGVYVDNCEVTRPSEAAEHPGNSFRLWQYTENLVKSMTE